MNEDRKFTLIFDDVITKQLKKTAKNQRIKEILSSMFDKIELLGPQAGKLLDSKLFIYEIKAKHPPIRLYFKYNLATNEIYIFEFEMKKSESKQQRTIDKIKSKLLRILTLFS